MSNKWVINASPLILLAKAGPLDLLSRLTEQLVIPASVVAEINQGPTHDPAQRWLSGPGARFICPDSPPDQRVSAWDLGQGETAVLSWAFLNRGFEVILDDRAARKCAEIHSIPFRGSIGVILAARKQNLIPAAKPICDDLVRAGLLIDGALLLDALRLVGE